MRFEKKALALAAVLILAVLPLVTQPLRAQIPDEFKNLKVLPEDISKGELIAQMRHMAGALGARCHYCHVGEPGASLDGYNFVSDEKATKKTARVMLQMVDEINGKLLPQIGKESSELVKVRCVTCHHGQSRPRTLVEVLTESLEQDGVDAAIAKYRELREKYYGRATFDFGEWRLLNLAEDLGGAGKLDEAKRFLELNVEFYPESGMSYVGLGQFHQRNGDNEQALVNYEKASELMPEMAPRIQGLIDQLGQE